MIQGLPEKLRDLRARFGLSQRAVAQHLGVSPSIISGYETGERTPSAESLLALSYLYRCSTDFLLGKDVAAQGISIDVNGLDQRQIVLLTELVDTMKK